MSLVHGMPNDGVHTAVPQKTAIYPMPLGADETRRLDDLYERLKSSSKLHAGYPCNQLFDYSEIFRFFNLSVNNVGDPFHGGNFQINTHEIEREVLEFFMRLYGTNTDDSWGYVTHGGTESNLYGLYLAREAMGNKGIIYYSEDTHYSVPKIVRLLNARHIMIKSLPNGEMDYDDLRGTLKVYRDVPPIIMANIGTTMTGAVDNLNTIRAILKDLAFEQHYIHCDAALSGLIVPFVKNPPPLGFAHDIDSIAISGHKMIGGPCPCGVVLARREHVNLVARGIEYVGVIDTTISGSRNAISPLFLWYAIKRYGYEGLERIVNESLEKAAYMVEKFKLSGVDAWRNNNSVTVVFPRPSDGMVRRWQLAPKDNIAHVITMPHLSYSVLDKIVDEIAQESRLK